MQIFFLTNSFRHTNIQIFLQGIKTYKHANIFRYTYKHTNTPRNTFFHPTVIWDVHRLAMHARVLRCG